MRPRRAPPFLARRAYRRRRMADAARLLPFVGAFLVMVPVLRRPAESPEADTAAGAVYLFSVWAGLILLSFLLSRWLPEGDEAGRDGDGADDGAS